MKGRYCRHINAFKETLSPLVRFGAMVQMKAATRELKLLPGCVTFVGGLEHAPQLLDFVYGSFTWGERVYTTWTKDGRL
jgi:hypothetical protein